MLFPHSARGQMQGDSNGAIGTIVVGTDGSETSDRAVDRAGVLAGALGVSVHVVSGLQGGCVADGPQWR